MNRHDVKLTSGGESQLFDSSNIKERPYETSNFNDLITNRLNIINACKRGGCQPE